MALAAKSRRQGRPNHGCHPACAGIGPIPGVDLDRARELRRGQLEPLARRGRRTARPGRARWPGCRRAPRPRGGGTPVPWMACGGRSMGSSYVRPSKRKRPWRTRPAHGTIGNEPQSIGCCSPSLGPTSRSCAVHRELGDAAPVLGSEHQTARQEPSRSITGPCSQAWLPSLHAGRGAAGDQGVGHAWTARWSGRSAPGSCVLVGVTHDDTPSRGPQARRADLAPAGHGRRRRRDEPVGGRHDPGGARGQPVHALRRHQPGPAAELDRGGPARAGRAARGGGGRRASRRSGPTVATGRFRTEMAVELVNDGPVTMLLEVLSRRRLRGRGPAAEDARRGQRRRSGGGHDRLVARAARTSVVAVAQRRRCGCARPAR